MSENSETSFKSESSDTTEPRPIIACRISVKTLANFISESKEDIVSRPCWEQMTHIVFDGLCFDQGLLKVGVPPKGADNHENVLNNPKTYTPILAKILKHWPHLKLVWTLPLLGDTQECSNFMEDLCYLSYKYRIDAVEGDYEVLLKYLSTNIMRKFGFEFWAVLSSESPWPWHKVFVPAISRYVIRSYGYLDKSKKLTRHGSFDQVRVAACSAVGHSRDAIDTMINTGWVVGSKMLLDIDTSGVDYIRKKADPVYAEMFKLVPYSSIQNLLHVKKGTLTSISNLDDNAHSYITYDEGGKHHYVSYDCASVLHYKLSMVERFKLGGVMVGDLANDGNLSNSVFNKTVKYIK